MNAEERKRRVGHGIDEVPDQMLPFRLEFIVLAAKGNDAHFALLPGQLEDAVAVQSGAIDEKVSREIAGSRGEHPALAVAMGGIDFCAGGHFAAAFLD